MKFKYLIIAFCVIMAIIVFVTVLMPAMISGPGYAASLRYITLPLLLLMSLLLLGVSIFFFLNYRLLSLLEREDWPALAYYLEQKIYVKKQYTSRYVRLLASSYLVISDFQSVLKLESKAILVKPSVVDKNVLIFGSARILSGNYEDANAFFKSYLVKTKGKEKQWVRWFYGFSNLLGGLFSQAEPEFSSLAVSSDDALVTGLSAYFLHSSLVKRSIKPDSCAQIAQNGKDRVLKAMKNPEHWKKETEKMGSEIHIAIVRKYIDETGKWIFGAGAAASPDKQEPQISVSSKNIDNQE